jgi:hypothetical protein
MAKLPVDEGMLKFYKELSKHSPPESANWPLALQRKAWDDVCRMFRAPRPERLMVRTKRRWRDARLPAARRAPKPVSYFTAAAGSWAVAGPMTTYAPKWR